MVVPGVATVDLGVVKTCASCLRCLIEEAGIAGRSACLHSFVKRIDISGEQVKVLYNPPMP
ncbi:hypothetical protein ACFLU4_04860 [Chloroflexota bacterium]